MVCTHSNAVVPFSKGQLQFNFWAVIFVVAVLFTFSLVISHKKSPPNRSRTGKPLKNNLIFILKWFPHFRVIGYRTRKVEFIDWTTPWIGINQAHKVHVISPQAANEASVAKFSYAQRNEIRPRPVLIQAFNVRGDNIPRPFPVFVPIPVDCYGFCLD